MIKGQKRYIRAQKEEMIKLFSEAQWNNMNIELPSHGWVLIGETPNSNPDIPEEIINFKKLKQETKKEPIIEVPETVKEEVVKKRSGRPKKK
jgi:predicted alternative tryptophan synthase beta-subunit